MKKITISAISFAVLIGMAPIATVFARSETLVVGVAATPGSEAVIKIDDDVNVRGSLTQDVEVRQVNRERVEEREMKQEEGINGDDDEDGVTDTKIAVSNTAGSAEDEDDSTKGKGEEHQSTVASLVKALLVVADEDEGVGEEVRVIAREQASSSEKVAVAAGKIEERGKFRTFLFGTDYKNIGAIRSEMVQTENRILKLDRELARVASSTDVSDVNVELAKLKTEQTALENFVKDNEDKFSLLGWLVRMFQ